jgi:ubiquinone/menaquinone biosynthesis C-methylase UbiE
MIYDAKSIKQQYVDDKNLAVRLNFHIKHSTNKQGLVSWLWEQYDFPENGKILELGCGNGLQWENDIKNLPSGCSVVLTDLSQGMVDIV